MSQKPKTDNQLRLALMLSLTLGLAPFLPEPHIWGKIKWLAGGGVGMELMDYFDVFLHGSPWLFLVFALVAKFRLRFKAHDEKRNR